LQHTGLAKKVSR